MQYFVLRKYHVLRDLPGHRQQIRHQLDAYEQMHRSSTSLYTPGTKDATIQHEPSILAIVFMVARRCVDVRCVILLSGIIIHTSAGAMCVPGGTELSKRGFVVEKKIEDTVPSSCLRPPRRRREEDHVHRFLHYSSWHPQPSDKLTQDTRQTKQQLAYKWCFSLPVSVDTGETSAPVQEAEGMWHFPCCRPLPL